VAELLDPTIRGQRAALERHHLFPKAHLKTLGIAGLRETNQIANFALVEWGDNTSISDQPPAEYLPALKERFSGDDLKQMDYWHALPENWENRAYGEFLEQRRDRLARVIADGYSQLVDRKEAAKPEDEAFAVEEMVATGESTTIEFKCAVRTNLHTGREDDRIIWSWLRTVAGFLNLKGGTLVIGVEDDGTPVGLEADGFESEKEIYKYVMALVKTRLGEPHLKSVHPRFDDYRGKRVLEVDCWAADEPAFLKDGGSEHFFLRTGATTEELSPERAQAYIKQRFQQ